MQTKLGPAEKILQVFDWRLFRPTGAWEWSPRRGISASAGVGDEVTKIELQLTMPNTRMEAAILPLMVAMDMLNRAAHGQAHPLPDSILVPYVAKQWFKPAAEDYLHHNMDRYVGEGGARFDQEDLFRQVMDKVFWPAVAIDMPDPDQFERDVYSAVDPDVWRVAQAAVRDAAREWTVSAAGRAGVSQRDFLG